MHVLSASLHTNKPMIAHILVAILDTCGSNPYSYINQYRVNTLSKNMYDTLFEYRYAKRAQWLSGAWDATGRARTNDLWMIIRSFYR